jgi:hypothetical protein
MELALKSKNASGTAAVVAPDLSRLAVLGAVISTNLRSSGATVVSYSYHNRSISVLPLRTDSWTAGHPAGSFLEGSAPGRGKD